MIESLNALSIGMTYTAQRFQVPPGSLGVAIYSGCFVRYKDTVWNDILKPMVGNLVQIV